MPGLRPLEVRLRGPSDAEPSGPGVGPGDSGGRRVVHRQNENLTGHCPAPPEMKAVGIPNCHGTARAAILDNLETPNINRPSAVADLLGVCGLRKEMPVARSGKGRERKAPFTIVERIQP